MTSNWTDALVLKILLLFQYPSVSHCLLLTLSEEITIPLSLCNFQVTLCFTLSSSESWANPEGARPWGGLFPQSAVAAWVVLVAATKSTTHLPPWGQVLCRKAASRHGWNRDHSGQGGQHVLHAETGVLVAKLVLGRRSGGRGLSKDRGTGLDTNQAYRVTKPKQRPPRQIQEGSYVFAC